MEELPVVIFCQAEQKFGEIPRNSKHDGGAAVRGSVRGSHVGERGAEFFVEIEFKILKRVCCCSIAPYESR